MWETLLGIGSLAGNDGLKDSWRKVGTLSEAVNGNSLVVINKKLYVYGGQTSGFAVHGKVWEIDIATGAVVAKTAGLGRRYHKAFVFNNKMYAHAGYTSGYVNDMAVYDPASNTWATVATNGVTPTACDRYSLAFLNNKAYYIGGQNGSPVAAGRLFDPATSNFANFSATGQPLPGDYLGAADVVDGKIYITYGFNSQSTFTCYDPVAGSNTVKASLPSTRAQHVAAAARKGIYLFGGTSGVAADASRTLRYDVASNVWGFLKPMPFTMGNIGSIASDGIKFYLLGGQAGSLDIYEYTP